MDTVKVVLEDGAYMPEQAHKADAGYDIRTPVDFTIAPFGYVMIDTGVHIQIPEGFVGILKSKSGLYFKLSITNTGVIDSGYTGTIRVKLHNGSNDIVHFNRGDKISQMVMLPVYLPNLVQVDSLVETERGNNGFGSTGR